jgi:hypothetical protein
MWRRRWRRWSFAHANTHPKPDSDAYSHSNTHSHANSDAYSHANAYSDTYADAHTDTLGLQYGGVSGVELCRERQCNCRL